MARAAASRRPAARRISSSSIDSTDKIVAAIGAMDAEVVGLMEIENDGSDPAPAIEALVDGLNDSAGPGTYAHIQTGDIGTDEIAVAIIYQPAEVTPLGELSRSSTRASTRAVDTRSRPAWPRRSTETATGAVFTVAVNHLKSKGSAAGPAMTSPIISAATATAPGRPQPRHWQIGWRATRPAPAIRTQ